MFDTFRYRDFGLFDPQNSKLVMHGIVITGASRTENILFFFLNYVLELPVPKIFFKKKALLFEK